jgi:alpha 1,3-glucosidase
MRDAVLIRYALLPYIYTLFHQVSINGLPPMRPLFVDYPSDPNCFKIQETFLFGSDLLVTPVVKEESQSANVYFPRGLWYDIYNHERIYGGIELDVDAPLNKIPVFQRGGSIIPRKLRVRRTSSQMEADPFTLFIALSDQNVAEGDIYIDDGKTYDYTSGKYAYRRIQYSQVQKEEGALAVITCTPEEYTNRHVTHNIGGTYNPTNTIEKVVVIGQKLKPTKIILFSKEEDKVGSNLEWEIEENKAQTYTIKYPECCVGNPWKISIQY